MTTSYKGPVGIDWRFDILPRDIDCYLNYVGCFAQIPGFMVMQVRYLYEAEGNKKAKDAKAVSFYTLKA